MGKLENLFDQLSDFGLAILDGSQKKNQLKLSGTLGYVAPEYLLDGEFCTQQLIYVYIFLSSVTIYERTRLGYVVGNKQVS